MTIRYEHWLVLASIAVAILASYAALSLASRVAVSRGPMASALWLLGGAVSMGVGIWSMHFVGMLATSLPIPMVYHVGWTLVSLLIAIVISGFALYLVSRATLSWRRLGTGAALLGTGIVSMHYSGMVALQIAPQVTYKPALFVLSVLIAMMASLAALWLSFQLRSGHGSRPLWMRFASSVVMGLAIAGMHYTGMAAANFAPGSICTVPSEAVSNIWLAATIAGFTVMLLALAVVASLFDSHLISRAARHAENLMQVNEHLVLEKLQLANTNEMLQREMQERIQERREFSESLMRLNAELEERVRRRTRELEAANKELEAFSYSVSHDLRTPLNTIDGFSQLLAKRAAGNLDEKGMHYVSRISAGARQMGQLIEGMLSFAKLARDPLKLGQVDLAAMATKLVSEYRETQPERKVLVNVQSDLVASGDPLLLFAVMQNLLANAWKFTSKKEQARIDVGSEIASNGGMVYFVRDNGAGFDMAYADRLFSTFQRLHSVEDFSGTGVGLAIVRRIISRHGGEIWADGEVGRGAEFRFTLGYAEGHASKMGEVPGSGGICADSTL